MREVHPVALNTRKSVGDAWRDLIGWWYTPLGPSERFKGEADKKAWARAWRGRGERAQAAKQPPQSNSRKEN